MDCARFTRARLRRRTRWFSSALLRIAPSAVASGIPRIFLYKKGSPFGLPEFLQNPLEWIAVTPFRLHSPKWWWGMDCARFTRARLRRRTRWFSSALLRTAPSAVASGIPRIFYTKKAALSDCRNFCKKNGGGGWIRTIEGMAGRFTVYCI